jgi:hypothetical protein
LIIKSRLCLDFTISQPRLLHNPYRPNTVIYYILNCRRRVNNDVRKNSSPKGNDTTRKIGKNAHIHETNEHHCEILDIPAIYDTYLLCMSVYSLGLIVLTLKMSINLLIIVSLLRSFKMCVALQHTTFCLERHNFWHYALTLYMCCLI